MHDGYAWQVSWCVTVFRLHQNFYAHSCERRKIITPPLQKNTACAQNIFMCRSFMISCVTVKKFLTGPAGIWTRISGFRVHCASHYTTGPAQLLQIFGGDKNLSWHASTGNRTRTSCLEGTNSNHWTIDAKMIDTHCGDRTRDHMIKSHALYHLS